MHLIMIAVIEKGEGFKLLDSDTGEVIYKSRASIVNAIQNKGITIANLRLYNGKLLGSNGGFYRYPQVDRDGLPITKNQAMIVINKLGNDGYTVTNWTGIMLKISKQEIMSACGGLIANGTLIPSDDGWMIKPICGKYDTVTWVEKANAKMQALGISGYKVGFNGDIDIYDKNLTACVIPNSVTCIRYKQFDGCEKLKRVVIPNTVTKIEYSAFSNCSSLEEIEIPGSVEIIERSAFSVCKNLKKVILNNGIVSIGSMCFRWCDKLDNISIPNSVDYIGEGAFSNCTELSELKIGHGMTDIPDRCFEFCTNLKSITLENNIKSLGEWAFGNCYSLQTVITKNICLKYMSNTFLHSEMARVIKQ